MIQSVHEVATQTSFILVRVPMLEVLPYSPEVAKIFNHWDCQLTRYLSAAVSQDESVDKLAILCGYVSAEVHALIGDFKSYEVLKRLREFYKRKKTVVIARHVLATRAQGLGEKMQVYFVMF